MLLGSTSCATLFTGTRDRLHFESNPSGAVVYIDGLEVGRTPCDVEVRRSLTDKYVEFKLDDYKTRVITLDREFNVVSVLNLGGLWGWAIDAATGSLMKYGRKGYEVSLESKQRTALNNARRIDINTKDKSVSIYQFQ